MRTNSDTMLLSVSSVDTMTVTYLSDLPGTQRKNVLERTQ